MRMCYNCFQHIMTDTGPCPVCGYDESGEKSYPIALKKGAILNGQYTIGRVLGQGGFGATYIAQRYVDKKLVAIKEYLPEALVTRAGTDALTVYSDQREREFLNGKASFITEAETLAACGGNDNIVKVFSCFEQNNTAYYVMEYVDGVSLHKYIKNNGGRIPPEEANKILLPLMRAMDNIHSKGIVHRDIAPDNIMINSEGVSKLIDFGAARHSNALDEDNIKSIDVVVKHGFAPKEQYSRHGAQGSYTDVYAMAATYYYSITGKVPPDALDRISEDKLVLPSALGVNIKPKAEQALCKALAIEAKNRYQSMSEFADELDDYKSPEVLLNEAFEALRNEAWNTADTLLDNVIKVKPDSGYAYAGKLMVEYCIADLEKLREQSQFVSGSDNYKLALQYADKPLKEILDLPIKGTTKLIDMAHEALAQQDWDKANKLFDIIIMDKDPAYSADAYVGKLLAALHLPVEQHLAIYVNKKQIASNKYYKLALKNAQPEMKARLESYVKKDEEPKDSERKSPVIQWAKTHLKLIIPIACALVLCVGIFAFVGNTNKGWSYEDNTSTLTVTGDMSEYSGKAAEDMPWAKYSNKTISLVVEGEVNTIVPNAFSQFTKLKTVRIGSGVSSIGSKAFSKCWNLQEVILGSGVRTIGNNAFFGCKNLTTITYTGTDDQWSAISISSGNDCITSAYETVVSSRSALIYSTESINIIAQDKGYNSVRLGMKLMPNQEYTLYFESVEVTAGKPLVLSLRLIDFANDKSISNELVDLAHIGEKGYAWTFKTPEKLSEDVDVSLYAGIHKYCNNIGVKYNGVKLYKGIYNNGVKDTLLTNDGIVAEKVYTLDKLSIEAADKDYNRVTLDYKFEPGQTYTLCIDNIKCAKGDAVGGSIRLWDFDNEKMIYSNLFEIKTHEGPYKCVFTVPKDLNDNTHLLIYAGIYGYCSGVAMTYEGINLYTGVYTG